MSSSWSNSFFDLLHHYIEIKGLPFFLIKKIRVKFNFQTSTSDLFFANLILYFKKWFNVIISFKYVTKLCNLILFKKKKRRRRRRRNRGKLIQMCAVVIRAQNHALGLELCPRTFRWSEEGRIVIRNSNLKSCKEGTNGRQSEGESFLGPNQRSSSVYSIH